MHLRFETQILTDLNCPNKKVTYSHHIYSLVYKIMFWLSTIDDALELENKLTHTPAKLDTTTY